MDRGVEQYAILGAGLDYFAYRRSDLLDRLQVFEVDHPASQGWKRRRLRELAVKLPGNLVFAPVDFEHRALREGLEDVGFEFQRSAIFSWIGVTMYLTLDAIQATLATIGQCLAGTQVALTYNQPRDSLDELSLQVTSTFVAIAAEMGERSSACSSRERLKNCSGTMALSRSRTSGHSRHVPATSIDASTSRLPEPSVC